MVHPVADADERSPFGQLTASEFYARHSVSHGSSSFVNPRGLRIFTQWWAPVPPAEVVGTIGVVHGFTGESSWLVQLTAVYFAKAGFAVGALDHQGHGFSDGLVAHIPDIEPVVDDCIAFFDAFRARYPPGLPCFLYAESLGGAIALLIHLRERKRAQNQSEGGVLLHDECQSFRDWDGLVLNGAMCGISPKFKPPWPLEHLLWVAAAVVPTWRVAVTRGSIPDVSFKVEWKRRLALASPRRTVARPRAATALELLRVCREVQGRYEEVALPMLIVHGGDDVVCDPACVEELYRRAGSKDKTLRIYPGMWHQLVGEPDENVELVFGEILDWLKARAMRTASQLQQERVEGEAAAF
ncbi:caffeoylshikimate esterase [Cocos nucifera]|uniref:Caffeoylshikimate esterase n=1 Tax=Cocos nucifera TaxID=13894 RepID=A0A8K0N8B4_COCNU|nr:caffeoylshikimate esterase [Cocos nucifera]